MKVADLIEELQLFDPEAEIVLQTDHGQTPMRCTWVGESYVRSLDNYMMEFTEEEEQEEDSENYGIFVVELQAF